MSLAEYRQWLIDLMSNYSDFYTYYLNESGQWTAEEYFFLDAVFTPQGRRRTVWQTEGPTARIRGKGYRRLTKRRNAFRNYVARAYLDRHRPDVIFVRSQPLPSAFWQRYRKDSLLVARLSARLPKLWHPNDFDLVYTDQPDFKHFLSCTVRRPSSTTRASTPAYSTGWWREMLRRGGLRGWTGDGEFSGPYRVFRTHRRGHQNSPGGATGGTSAETVAPCPTSPACTPAFAG